MVQGSSREPRRGAQGRSELPAAPCSSTGSCPPPWSLASAQPRSRSSRRAGQSPKTRLFCGVRQEIAVITCWRGSQRDWPCHKALRSCYDCRAQGFPVPTTTLTGNCSFQLPGAHPRKCGFGGEAWQSRRAEPPHFLWR